MARRLLSSSLLVLALIQRSVLQQVSQNSVIDDQSVCPADSDVEDNGVACRTHDDCSALGQVCCGTSGKKTCVKNRNEYIKQQQHSPFLGLIPRECPTEPMPEPFPIRNCSKDADCWPRICCPDGEVSYCRTAMPLWDELPAQTIVSPLRNMMAYLQCTPPPPPHYDLFPKPCRSTVDCFPNLCCQEKDKKVCRPPKKSLLALITAVTQERRRLGWFG